MVLLCAVMLQAREWPLMTSRGSEGNQELCLTDANPRIAQVDR